MIELMVTAMASGSGKTMLSCGLLKVLQERGYHPCAFKCGPDYIDPMYHRAVKGIQSHNLDLFLMREDENALQAHYEKYLAGHDAAVTEGVMGFYDGLGGVSERASSYAVARALGIPALLMISPQKNSLSLAAQVRGMLDFRPDSNIRALLFNNCTESTCRMLKDVMERETGLPVLGFIPPMREAALESRHLGLLTAGEIADLADRLDKVAEQIEKNVDIEKLCKLFTTTDKKEAPSQGKAEAPLSPPGTSLSPSGASLSPREAPVRIAVAKDEVFCFLYEESLDLLRALGAEPVFFSPLHDYALPCGCGGLVLPGGYPELFAAELSGNLSMKASVREALAAGRPCIAECGGMMYLQEEMEGAGGQRYPMAAFLPGTAVKKERPVRFGYSYLTAEVDNLLFRKGESIPVHEFHYYDTDNNGSALCSVKPLTNKSWTCCFADGQLYAGFPHLYLAGSPVMAHRFTEAARRWAKDRGSQEARK